MFVDDLSYQFTANNETGDAGAQEIAKALQSNKTLQSLNIACKKNQFCRWEKKSTISPQKKKMKVNNIGDQGGKMLLEGISKNNTLKEIVISDNEITQNVLKELRKLKLKVVSDEEED